jgi:hypothetical protein
MRSGRLLVVGPVRGLNDRMSDAVLKPLRDAIRARIAQERSVPLAPGAVAGVSFSVEVSFHRVSERVHIAFVLRCEPTREVVASFRETFAGAIPKTAMVGLARSGANCPRSSITFAPAGDRSS